MSRGNQLQTAYLCDGIRTPFGRYGGVLSGIRTDDLAALPLKALMERNPGAEWGELDDVIFGCTNQAGEDNRNVARMALLLAELPETVPGATINRLCGSGMEAVSIAARTIMCGDASLMIAGGVESMSRAPFVMGKQDKKFSRNLSVEDTTMGWRFVNPRFKELYGTDSMPETAEIVAKEYRISRAHQDEFALRSQQRTARAVAARILSEEIIPVSVPQAKGEPLRINIDEHPRPGTTIDALAKLKPIVTPEGTVTAGNASGINDGSCAVILASEAAVAKHDLKPMARFVASAVCGIAPRVMGMGPVPATQKVMAKSGLALSEMSVIELNEAFAAQALAVMRELKLPDDAAHVNPNGGAIALGHPLGASGTRLVITAARQLRRIGGRYALCTMCIGVGQGIATIIERI